VGFQLAGGLAQRCLHFRDAGQRVEQAVVVDHAVVAHRGDLDAGGVQFAGVGLAFIAQHVEPGGLHQCRRQAAQLLGAGTQRRGVDVGALFRVGGVVVPEPFHHPGGEEVALGVLLVRGGIEARIGDRPQQQLEAQPGRVPLLGHQADHRRHVAADAVAGHRQAIAVDVDFLAVLGHPAGRGVGLVDRGRVVRFGRWRVVDIHRHGAGADHQVADQAGVGRVVAEHPAAAVEEHEHRQLTRHAGRSNDGQADILPVAVDGLFTDFGAGQIDLHRSLGAGQHRAGIRRAEMFEGLAAAGRQGIEEGLGLPFGGTVIRGEGIADGQG